jgi:hypothetical protein
MSAPPPLALSVATSRPTSSRVTSWHCSSSSTSASVGRCLPSAVRLPLLLLLPSFAPLPTPPRRPDELSLLVLLTTLDALEALVGLASSCRAAVHTLTGEALHQPLPTTRDAAVEDARMAVELDVWPQPKAHGTDDAATRVVLRQRADIHAMARAPERQRVVATS